MIVSSYINPAKKKQWTRRVAMDTAAGQNMKPGRGCDQVVMTQDDFLNEISPAAHNINSPYMSKRPIYGPTDEKDANGKTKWKITGYDDVETVALGLQECIIGKKISHFASDGFWLANETKDKERFEVLRSQMDITGLKEAAWTALVRSVFRTGDGAIYLYQTEDGIEYEVYGYEEGSTLYPFLDAEGHECVARKYKYENREAVDIFTCDYVETWMQYPAEEVMGREQSEDGYTLVRRKKNQAGAGRCQCIYFRVDDIPTGPAQLSIASLENACTYLGEELKNSAFPILFLKSEKIVNLPPSKMNGKTIGVKGTAESIQNADAKFLAPPDASNIAETHHETLWNNIVRTSMSAFIEPDILKAGSDSSTTIKILFAPEIQWCKNTWPYFFKGVKKMVNVFKALVGKVEEDIAGYESLKVSVGQNIWLPQNVSELVKNECDQVYARIKSREAAMEDLGSAHIDDYETIQKEWEYELEIKSSIPAKYSTTATTTVTEETNPEKTPVDNNASGKSIQN